MAMTTKAFAEVSQKQRRQAERKRLAASSLLTQLAWWGSEDRKGEFPMHSLRAEVKRIQKRLARLAVITPSPTWAEDARRLRPHEGAEFPPADECGVPLMGRAKGEACFYPPAYLTSSGHSWDVYVQAIHTGASEMLQEDGYQGARVTIYDLTPMDRARIRRAESRATRNDRHAEKFITNVF